MAMQEYWLETMRLGARRQNRSKGKIIECTSTFMLFSCGVNLAVQNGNSVQNALDASKLGFKYVED